MQTVKDEQPEHPRGQTTQLDPFQTPVEQVHVPLLGINPDLQLKHELERPFSQVKHVSWQSLQVAG